MCLSFTFICGPISPNKNLIFNVKLNTFYVCSVYYYLQNCTWKILT